MANHTDCGEAGARGHRATAAQVQAEPQGLCLGLGRLSTRLVLLLFGRVHPRERPCHSNGLTLTGQSQHPGAGSKPTRASQFPWIPFTKSSLPLLARQTNFLIVYTNLTEKAYVRCEGKAFVNFQDWMRAVAAKSFV